MSIDLQYGATGRSQRVWIEFVSQSTNESYREIGNENSKTLVTFINNQIVQGLNLSLN